MGAQSSVKTVVMASDTEDDDLASLRQAALKTLKPKAQPIQQVVTLSGGNRSQPIPKWEGYPASADIVPEFHYQPEPLPEPEPFPTSNLAVPPPSIRPPLAMQGIQIVPTQLPLWQQPYTNGVQGPRSFRPQVFTLSNRPPYDHARTMHRTFGDRGRPLMNRGRFPRRGYMPERGGAGQFIRPRGPVAAFKNASDTEAAAGNLIVIRPKSAYPSASVTDERKEKTLPVKTSGPPQTIQLEESKPKLLLPQDKYHSSQTTPATASGSIHTGDSSSSTKAKDKFSRYNDSDSDEDEEEEEHSDTEDITRQIDNFLNDNDELDILTAKEEEPLEAATQEKVPEVESSGTNSSEVKEESSQDLDSIVAETKELTSSEASDTESLDLDALASGDMPVLFEDGVGEKVVNNTSDSLVSNDITDINEQKEKETSEDSALIKGTGDSKEVHGNKDSPGLLASPKSSSSSSSTSSSSLSESGDSSSDEEDGEKVKKVDEEADGDSSDLDNILNMEESSEKDNGTKSSLNKQEFCSSPNEVLSKKSSPRQYNSRTSPSLSPRHLSSPHSKSKPQPAHHRSKSRSPNTNHRKDKNLKGSTSHKRQSTSVEKSSPRHALISLRHASHSPRYSEDYRRRPSSRDCRLSPNQTFGRRSFSPRGGSRLKPFSRQRSTSPQRRLSPRQRSRSPRIYSSSARYRSKSPRDRPRGYHSPALRDNQRREDRDRRGQLSSNFSPSRREGFVGSHRSKSCSRNTRSRSHSRERYKKPLEVRSVKQSSSKKESGLDQRKAKKIDSPPPQVDLDKLTPEERAKIEARRKKFSSNKVIIDPAKKVSLKSIKERPKKKKKAKDTEPAGSSDSVKADQKSSKKHKKMLTGSPVEQKKDVRNESLIDDSSDDSDSGRAWRQSSKKGKNYDELVIKSHKSESRSLDRHKADSHKYKNLPGRSVKERLGYVGSRSRQDWTSENEDDENESHPTVDRLTSSIVKVNSSQPFIPEKLKIEIVSTKKSKTKSKVTAKPDFSKVYAVPAKRGMIVENEKGHIEEAKVMSKKKKKKHRREIEELIDSEAEESAEEPQKQPVRPSVMDRLGKKVPLPEFTKKEKKKKRKHLDNEPTTELDAKILKIKEKNAAIARRQQEIEQDKQRYG